MLSRIYAVVHIWWLPRRSRLLSWCRWPVHIGVDMRIVRWWRVFMVSHSRKRKCWMNIWLCWKKPRSVIIVRSVRKWIYLCSPTQWVKDYRCGCRRGLRCACVCRNSCVVFRHVTIIRRLSLPRSVTSCCISLPATMQNMVKIRSSLFIRPKKERSTSWNRWIVLITVWFIRILRVHIKICLCAWLSLVRFVVMSKVVNYTD